MHTRLKEVRKAAGYKQQDAAEAFGVSLGTYRNWEQGRVIMNGEPSLSKRPVCSTQTLITY